MFNQRFKFYVGMMVKRFEKCGKKLGLRAPVSPTNRVSPNEFDRARTIDPSEQFVGQVIREGAISVRIRCYISVIDGRNENI
jgi:hypothetical protein